MGNCYSEYISGYLNDLENGLRAESLSEMVFRNLDRTVDELDEQIRNKEAVLKRITFLEKELDTL